MLDVILFCFSLASYIAMFVLYVRRTDDIRAIFWLDGLETFLKFSWVERGLFVISCIFLFMCSFFD